MSNVPPTILDISRSVVRLDEHADIPAKGTKVIDGTEWTRHDLIVNVAGNIKFAFRNSGLGKKFFTKATVSAILYTHGASPFTVEQYAGKIARELKLGHTSQM